MSLKRRDLIRSSALAMAGLGLAGAPALLASDRPKRILILGGTGFIGPNTVRYAVERGHQVSIFTRGRRETDLPASVERLVGDRNDDHSALEGREWDAVLDNNCYDYRWAQKSTALLRNATDHYLFVSSLSAYAMPSLEDLEPSRPVTTALPLDAPTVPVPEDFRDGDEADYALMKVLSERAVQAAFPGRCTIVRPTLIVGPGDHSGRWSYWPVRMHRGGEVLAPGNPAHSTQIIDQRDLSEWHIRLVEQGQMGVFNGAGPADHLTMESMLTQVRDGVGSSAEFTWVPEDFLDARGVQPWSDMPAWLPAYPMMYVDIAASLAASLTFRPIGLTARDTLAFENARPADDGRAKPFPFTAERERAVLEAWAAENAG
jgi:2'-hydroxyisoflavone reductase